MLWQGLLTAAGKRAGFLERLGPFSLDPTEGLWHDAEKAQFRLKKYQELGVGVKGTREVRENSFQFFLLANAEVPPAEIPCGSEALGPIVAMLSNSRGSIYLVLRAVL